MRCRKLHVAIPIRSGGAVWEAADVVDETAVENSEAAKAQELRFRKSRRCIDM
jgi:hypothetical protein